jgi:glucan phosphoethanolaminetransferase (alkaline phosphatase superfamily)
MAVPHAIRRIAADLVLWYGIVAAFLLLYVRVYAQPASAVAPHLAVIALPFAAMALARLFLSRLITHATLNRAVASMLTFAVLALLLVYYLFVLVGLRSWGGVVDWSVIPTFFEEGPEFLDALGVPRALVIGALGLVAACLFAGCWVYLGRYDWTASVRLSNAAVIACLAAGFAILAVASYDFVNAPWAAQSEPVSLTLFPDAGARNLEGHLVNPQTARSLDSVEDRARAAYVPADTATANRRNLIMIVVDALRPDHMGVLGYARDTTPNLSRLERTREVRRWIAHSSCANTICGLMSLANSKFPRRLSLRPFSLTEVLRRNGYRVHLILSGDHTHFYGMKDLYGAADSFYDGNSARRRGYFLNDDQLVVDRLASMPSWDGVPTMFQFHLMSVHVLAKHDDSGGFQPARGYLPTSAEDIGAPGRRDDSAINFYDNGVVKADATIAQLLDILRDKGYLRNTLVVITADHGESLGEHGLYGHGNSVREEVLRIPLLLVSYGYGSSARIDPHRQALQVDIAPTILAEFGIPQPQTWVGKPLQQPAGPAFAYFDERLYTGLFDMRVPGKLWKYWVDVQGEHAFDLSGDPHETRDLIAGVPGALRREWRVQAALGAPLGAANTAPVPTDNLRPLPTLKGVLSSVTDTRRN